MARKQVVGGVGRIVPGTANLAEAPGGLRRFFRFSQLAVGEAGGTRNLGDIWATVLQELEDAGVPAEARSRIESLGAKNIINRGPRIPESVVKLAGGTANVQIIKDTVSAARQATKGISAGSLEKEVSGFLDLLSKEPSLQDANGKRIIAELRAANPQSIARAGANQTVSVLSRRGGDPFVVSLYRKALKRTPTARIPAAIEATLKEAAGGTIPKVTSAARAALGGEVAGAGAFGAAARKGLGFLGKSALGFAGTGIFAALELGRARKVLGRSGRAKALALQGFQEVGPSSSVEFLRDTVRQQEAVARRKTVMQQFEPELFQEVLRVLSDTGPSKETLTRTERRIGANSQVGAASRGREPEDVEFLLDQLFQQMG